MSRQSSPDRPLHNSSPPTIQREVSEQPSSSLGRQTDSDGYPSWLPRRPPPPPPASTFDSSVGLPDVEPTPFVGGRKPTPRSVRIVSLQQQQQQPVHSEKGRREATDDTRVADAARAWSKASGAAVSPAVFAAGNTDFRPLQPKFRARGLHIELLRSPSQITRLYFYLYPFLVFSHIPLQCFFDFNAVYILFQWVILCLSSECQAHSPTLEFPNIPTLKAQVSLDLARIGPWGQQPTLLAGWLGFSLYSHYTRSCIVLSGGGVSVSIQCPRDSRTSLIFQSQNAP